MIKDIEKTLIEGNLRFQWKITQDLENLEVEEKIPKYPVLILTCMDPKIDIHRIFQLKPGDVFVLRNAGNVYTQDMLRSILISIFDYHVKYIIILGHMDCGMTKFELTEFKKKLLHKILSNSLSNNSDVFSETRQFFKPIVDELRNIKNHVEILKRFQEFFPEIEITGMLYDVNTGWVFEYEKFKDFSVIWNFRRQYETILTEKKYQFIDFFNTIEHEIVEINDLVKPLKESEVNDVEIEQFPKKIVDEHAEISNISEIDKKKKDNSEIERQKFELKQKYKVQGIMPKIKVPKIQFQGVKIHIPNIINKRRERMNKD